jgi:tagatose 6-phosphate kinase
LVEEGQPISPTDYAELDAIIARHVPRSQAVVMSGSITPGGPTDLYLRTTELARAAGVLSVVDAQGAPLVQALAAGPGLVKPNRAELAATVGRKLADEPALCSAMRELHARGAQRVVVTAGKDPALAFDGRKFWRITAPVIKVVNPIGSGDAFTAALVWRLLRGDDLGEACRWASASGAANALSLLPGEMEPPEMERLAGEVGVEVVGGV